MAGGDRLVTLMAMGPAVANVMAAIGRHIDASYAFVVIEQGALVDAAASIDQRAAIVDLAELTEA